MPDKNLATILAEGARQVQGPYALMDFPRDMEEHLTQQLGDALEKNPKYGDLTRFHWGTGIELIGENQLRLPISTRSGKLRYQMLVTFLPRIGIFASRVEEISDE